MSPDDPQRGARIHGIRANRFVSAELALQRRFRGRVLRLTDRIEVGELTDPTEIAAALRAALRETQ